MDDSISKYRIIHVRQANILEYYGSIGCSIGKIEISAYVFGSV